VAGAVLLTAPVASGQPVCLPTFRSEAGERWTNELQAVRSELATRADVDHCASIWLVATTDGARVLVTLVDGRSTARRAASPPDLRATLIALLLVPEAPDAAAGVADPPRADPPSPAPAPVPSPGADAAPQERATSPPSGRDGAAIDLGATGSGRWSGRYPGASLAAFADLTLGPWVVGVSGRFASYDGPGSSPGRAGYALEAIEIGAEAGYRFPVGPTFVTVAAGPSFVDTWQALSSPTGSKTGAPIAVGGSPRDGRVLRLGGAVRCTFLSWRRLRLFAGADASVDAMADSGNSLPGATTDPLPTWSAGVSLGGAVGVWP
jgi:hypothetical protein